MNLVNPVLTYLDQIHFEKLSVSRNGLTNNITAGEKQ